MTKKEGIRLHYAGEFTPLCAGITQDLTEVLDNFTETQALRYNEGKPKLSMIDLNCLEPCANVLEYGSKKYARDNWKKGSNLSQLLDCLLRHVAALQRGEFVDKESGLSHIGHIQCNALFLGNPNLVIDIKEDNFNQGKDNV